MEDAPIRYAKHDGIHIGYQVMGDGPSGPVVLGNVPVYVDTEEPALEGSAENATARPDVAVPDTLYGGSPTTAPAGGDDVKLIACPVRPTEKDCCAREAAW